MELAGQLDVDVTEDSVAFAFTVRNEGDERAELTFADAQKADFAVLDGDDEVWRFSDGMMFAQMLQTESIAPGGVVTYDGTWESPRPGDYDVVATLVANNASVEARDSFSV